MKVKDEKELELQLYFCSRWLKLLSAWS